MAPCGTSREGTRIREYPQTSASSATMAASLLPSRPSVVLNHVGERPISMEAARMLKPERVIRARMASFVSIKATSQIIADSAQGSTIKHF